MRKASGVRFLVLVMIFFFIYLFLLLNWPDYFILFLMNAFDIFFLFIILIPVFYFPFDPDQIIFISFTTKAGFCFIVSQINK